MARIGDGLSGIRGGAGMGSDMGELVGHGRATGWVTTRLGVGATKGEEIGRPARITCGC